jgi:hypothetical protein
VFSRPRLFQEILVLRTLLGTTLAAVVFIGPAPAQEKARFLHLQAALYELVQARKELSDAGGDFGGHRKKALTAMDDAIRSIRVTLAVKGGDPNVVVRKPEFYRKYNRYPHLRQVLVDLREARQELKDAKAGFQGNKERALADIDKAIRQVKLAIDNAKD